MPRKVDPSELSVVSRQILSRMSDPPVDLNDLWVVPAAECEDLLREAYGKYGLETLPMPEVASSPPATYQPTEGVAMASRKQTITLGIAMAVAVLAVITRLWFAVPLLAIAVLLFWWGLEPKRTEAFIGRLPYGSYLLKALAELDSIISGWS
jgi:hypothetical protein